MNLIRSLSHSYIKKEHVLYELSLETSDALSILLMWMRTWYNPIIAAPQEILQTYLILPSYNRVS